MENSLILVVLDRQQISMAKKENGCRKQITHALLCGEYGQLMGTEKHCSKYYNAWKEIFKGLFKEVKSVESYPVEKYENTFDLVSILIAESVKHESNASQLANVQINNATTQKKGFWARIFG